MCAIENGRRDSARVVSWHRGVVRGSCYRRKYKNLGDGKPGIKFYLNKQTATLIDFGHSVQS